MSVFDAAIDAVLKTEGGYKWDPEDPGGETNFGISKRIYPHLDIKALTEQDARAIYKRDFWEILHCDELPPPVAFVVFDCAINQGQPSAAIFLQQSVGAKPDGIIGSQTLAAIQKKEAGPLLTEFIARRGFGYAQDKPEKIKRYGLGWFRRLAHCHQAAMELSHE